MQTIIMTVGTSLRTNRDDDLKPEDKRPWAGKRVPDNQKAIQDINQAIAWMDKTSLEIISAETNTIWRLDPMPDDEIVLLHSDTISGLECAVNVCRLPILNYRAALDGMRSPTEGRIRLFPDLTKGTGTYFVQ